MEGRQREGDHAWVGEKNAEEEGGRKGKGKKMGVPEGKRRGREGTENQGWGERGRTRERSRERGREGAAQCVLGAGKVAGGVWSCSS